MAEDGEGSEPAASTDVWLTQTTQIGRHRGHVAAIGVSRSPEAAPAPDEFGVNLFVTNEHGENVDVVRVDTAHSGCHVDRRYLPDEHPKRRDYSPTFFSPEAVFEWLTAGGRWRSFLDTYEANHGLPATAGDRLN